LFPAGVPLSAGVRWLGWPGTSASGPSGPAWEPSAPVFAAGPKDGGVWASAGVPAGAVGENLGILAAAVAWEAALGGMVAVGADSEAAGP
jgi:hypothetical protein